MLTGIIMLNCEHDPVDDLTARVLLRFTILLFDCSQKGQ